MFALEISEKIRFFALFLAFLGKILMILKKIISTVLAFLQGLYLASSAFRDYTKSLTIISGLGKNNVATKKQIGAKKVIWRKRFFRFYAIIAADKGFRSAALEQRKNTTNSKKSKLSKTLYWTFCQLFFNFRTLVRILLDHWYNFFYSHYFCFKFGRMLQDADVKMYCNFQIFLFGIGDMIFYMWKMTKSPLKNQQFIFVLSKKFAQFFINIYTNFGFWPTFSVPNEFF